MKCPHCNSGETMLNGKKKGRQRYICKGCGKYFTENQNYSGTSSRVSKIHKTKNKKMGISTEDFMKKHDVVYILSQVFEKIEDDMFYEKSDIIKMAKLSPGYPGISTVLDSEGLKQYRGRAGSTDYWAKPELIEKLKDEGIMR